MIGLLALALQAATPDVVTDTVSVGPAFEVTAETKPMIFRYMDCLQPPGVLLRPPTSGTAVAQAEARIAACADTRKWALSAGVSAYRREPGGDPDAAHFLNKSLDTLEQGLLLNAQFTDKLISGVIKPADLQHQPVTAVPGGTSNGPRLALGMSGSITVRAAGLDGNEIPIAQSYASCISTPHFPSADEFAAKRAKCREIPGAEKGGGLLGSLLDEFDSMVRNEPGSKASLTVTKE